MTIKLIRKLVCRRSPGSAELERKVESGLASSENYRQLGKVYLDRGDFNKLIKLYEKALTLQISNLERAALYYEMGEAFGFLNGGDKAVTYFEKSLQLLACEDENESVLDFRGMNYYMLMLKSGSQEHERYASFALAEFYRLLEKYPNYQERYMVYSHVAEIHLKLDEYAKALNSYKKAFRSSKITSEKLWSLRGMASAYKAMGDFKKSERTFQKVVEMVDNKCPPPKVYYDLGELYFTSKQFEKAVEAFHDTLKYLDNDPFLRDDGDFIVSIFWHVGTTYYQLKNYEKAIKYLKKALELINEKDSYFCNINLSLGHCFFAKRNYGKAQKYYKQVLSSSLATEEEKEMAIDCVKDIEKRTQGI